MRRPARVPALLAFSALAALGTACSEAPAEDPRASTADAASADSAPPAELSSIALHVPDMSCALCARPIEHHLREMGVRDVKADLETKWVTGRFDPQRLTPEAIRAKIEELQFQVTEVRVG